MPKDIYKHLKHVWVCGRKLGLSRLAGGGRGEGASPDEGATFRAPKGERKRKHRAERAE
jgi:hypothetical protein